MDDIRASLRAELSSEIPTPKRFREDLKRELQDPDLSFIRNLRSLPLDVIESFNPAIGSFEHGHDADELDEDYDEDPTQPSKKPRKIHAPHSYLYKIGEYYDSTYFTKFLSHNIVNLPGGRVRTIREHTRRVSCMPKSTFRSWFRMPLAKVEAIAARFVSEKWMTLSKHCSNIYKLKIKSELMVMGALAILGETVSSFCQLPTMTHICATEHSKFFLLFVQKLSSIAD
jgi:hypothetical protein